MISLKDLNSYQPEPDDKYLSLYIKRETEKGKIAILVGQMYADIPTCFRG